jgi:hypothetical protein
MNALFLFLELFLYAFAGYLLFKKGDLGIIYLPVLFFIDTVIDSRLVPAFAYYSVIILIILKFIKNNGLFLTNNIFALLLFSYFLLLTTKSNDLIAIRQSLFNVMWFFILLPVIPSIYKKYSKEEIIKELAQCALIILLIFFANVVLSTYFKFNPYAMYGISTGIMYGNLYATDFNIIGIAIFILLLYSLKNIKIFNLALVAINIAFIVLSMRRSVLGITVIGMGIVAVIYLIQNPKKILLFCGFALLAGVIIITRTNVLTSVSERYELRNLEERNLNEEARYFEYDMLYNDIVKHKRYSGWIGFDLFNSPGNYGDGRFYERSLHGDIPSILHSSGIIGVLLYLLMIASAFYKSFKATTSGNEKLIVLFCIITFITYCLTGRYTQVGTMLLLFLVAQLPLAKEETELALYVEPEPGRTIPALYKSENPKLQAG